MNKIKYNNIYFDKTNSGIEHNDQEIENIVNAMFDDLSSLPKYQDGHTLEMVDNVSIIGFKEDDVIDIIVAKNYRAIEIKRDEDGEFGVENESELAIRKQYRGYDVEDLIREAAHNKILVEKLKKQNETLVNNDIKEQEFNFNDLSPKFIDSMVEMIIEKEEIDQDCEYDDCFFDNNSCNNCQNCCDCSSNN